MPVHGRHMHSSGAFVDTLHKFSTTLANRKATGLHFGLGLHFIGCFFYQVAPGLMLLFDRNPSPSRRWEGVGP
uniref:Uncharacterized protein n=1 Tax=Anopheles dirus TaxID=7168 RepID=A0A182NY59_9DIPT